MLGRGRAKSGAVGAMVSARGKLTVLGEELDLRGQGGTIRKLRVSSTRWDGESLLVPVCFDMILRFLGKKGARGVIFCLCPD